MLASVFGKTVWDNRRAIWWWAGGVLALTAMMVGFWPSVQDMGAFTELLENYPEALLAIFGIEDATEFLTAAGFMSGELYSALLPIIFLVFAIQRGAAATAGAEQDGTMDLTLSLPVTRRRVVLDSFLALTVLTIGLGAVIAVVLLAGGTLVDLGLSTAGVLAINLGLVLLGLVFGALAMAIGAWTGRRMLASGVSAAVAVAAFFVNGLAPLISALERPQQLSPFHWLLDAKPLSTGFDVPGLALLGGTALALLFAAGWAFERRDIST